jgi:hypothetical protein
VLAHPRQGVVVGQSAEVDDVPEAGALRGVPERRRLSPFALGQATEPALHPVHEVHRRVATGERALQVDPACHVTDGHGDLPDPRMAGEVGPVPGEGDHVVAGVEQGRDEGTPDGAGRAGDEDAHGTSWLPGRGAADRFGPGGYADGR